MHETAPQNVTTADKARALANVRACAAVVFFDIFEDCNSPQLARMREALGIEEFTVGLRTGVWIARFEVAHGVERVTITGEGVNEVAAQRDAIFHLARFYALRANATRTVAA